MSRLTLWELTSAVILLGIYWIFSSYSSAIVFVRIVSSERIRIVSLYSAELETSTADFTQSVPAALAQTAWFWETIRRIKKGRGSWLGSMQARDTQCGNAVISALRGRLITVSNLHPSRYSAISSRYIIVEQASLCDGWAAGCGSCLHPVAET